MSNVVGENGVAALYKYRGGFVRIRQDLGGYYVEMYLSSSKRFERVSSEAAVSILVETLFTSAPHLKRKDMKGVGDWL